jgi:transcriptional regulator with XRE-family HTH domain
MDRHSAKETTVGKNLRRLRMLRAVTQTALAERSGVDASTINRIERGWHDTPRADTVGKLAMALDVDPDEFFK